MTRVKEGQWFKQKPCLLNKQQDCSVSGDLLDFLSSHNNWFKDFIHVSHQGCSFAKASCGRELFTPAGNFSQRAPNRAVFSRTTIYIWLASGACEDFSEIDKTGIRAVQAPFNGSSIKWRRLFMGELSSGLHVKIWRHRQSTNDVKFWHACRNTVLFGKSVAILWKSRWTAFVPHGCQSYLSQKSFYMSPNPTRYEWLCERSNKVNALRNALRTEHLQQYYVHYANRNSASTSSRARFLQFR